MTHHSASRCVFATYPTCWRPGHLVCPQRSPGTCSRAPRPTPLPTAGNWVRFFCSIPPLFVLSHSMPMTNTTGKLASFWPFSLTTGSLPSDSLASILPPLASTSYDLPRWLLPATDRPFAKSRTGPISASESSISVCHRTRRFLRTKQFVPLHSPLTR